MLERLRQYGWEWLVVVGELDRVRDRHRDGCSAVAARCSTILAPDERADHDATLATARITLGEGTFHQAWAEGQVMTLEQAIADALDEGGA